MGLRLLKYVAERFDRAIQAAEHQAEKTANKVIEERLAEEQRKLRRMEVIHAGRLAQLEPYAESAPNAVRELEALMKEFSGDRTIAMLLGWLYANRFSDRERDAIRVLTDVIEVVSRSESGSKVDWADMLDNRASYYARLAKKAIAANQETEAAQYTERAASDLDKSCELKPANWKFAIEGDKKAEFRELIGRPAFAKLAERHR